ncbi:uncharacterized protein C8orf76 homolog isoform X3 [Lithobates pipiens]
MRRDVRESQARCLIHLERFPEALEIAQALDGPTLGSGEIVFAGRSCRWWSRPRESTRSSTPDAFLKDEMKVVNNTDHLTVALNLQVTIHNHLGNLKEVVSCLQQLVTLHSFNPHFWISLAESYRSLSFASSHCRNGSVNFSEPSVREHWCVENSNKSVDTANMIQRHCSNTSPSVLECCRNSTQLWIWSCASFIRARILLHFIQPQHASFTLDHNLKTQDYIEEQLNQMGLAEESQSLITNVMSEDLLAERIQEEGQIDTKSTLALNTFTMPTDTEFKEKWFKKIQTLLLGHG